MNQGHDSARRVGPGRLIDPARVLDDLKHPGLVSAIDLARWLAAAMVVVGHARFPLLKGYGLLTPEERPLWVQGWYFVSGYFVEAVLVFFVLSGFLVGGMVCARLARGTFDPGSYAIDRFSRLYTAFLPALLLTVALTWIGIQWFGGTGLYDASNPTFVEKDSPIDMAANSGLSTLLGNVAMLQFYFVEPYGSNPPLWTLSSEFWFYTVFGLAAVASVRTGPIRLLIAALALAATLALGPVFLLYLGMWLIGIAAAVLRPPRVPIALPAIVLLGALLLLRRYADAALNPSEAARYAIQYGICIATGLILLGWRARPPRWAERIAGFNRFMADFSYSLYLTHYPVLILWVAVLGTITGHRGFFEGFAPTHPLALGAYAGAIALTFGFAWLFAQATENQTGKVRRALKAKLFARPPTESPEPDRGHAGIE